MNVKSQYIIGLRLGFQIQFKRQVSNKFLSINKLIFKISWIYMRETESSFELQYVGLEKIKPYIKLKPKTLSKNKF